MIYPNAPMPEKDKPYLVHYGVMGMKWGVRKDGMPQGFQYDEQREKKSEYWESRPLKESLRRKTPEEKAVRKQSLAVAKSDKTTQSLRNGSASKYVQEHAEHLASTRNLKNIDTDVLDEELEYVDWGKIAKDVLKDNGISNPSSELVKELSTYGASDTVKDKFEEEMDRYLFDNYSNAGYTSMHDYSYLAPKPLQDLYKYDYHDYEEGGKRYH